MTMTSASPRGRHDSIPLCQGKHLLFDSTEPDDHELAAKFCNWCPLINACEQHLTTVQARGGLYGQPEGTWAGQLLIDPNYHYTASPAPKSLEKAAAS